MDLVQSWKVQNVPALRRLAKKHNVPEEEFPELNIVHRLGSESDVPAIAIRAMDFLTQYPEIFKRLTIEYRPDPLGINWWRYPDHLVLQSGPSGIDETLLVKAYFDRLGKRKLSRVLQMLIPSFGRIARADIPAEDMRRFIYMEEPLRQLRQRGIGARQWRENALGDQLPSLLGFLLALRPEFGLKSPQALALLGTTLSAFMPSPFGIARRPYELPQKPLSPSEVRSLSLYGTIPAALSAAANLGAALTSRDDVGRIAHGALALWGGINALTQYLTTNKLLKQLYRPAVLPHRVSRLMAKYIGNALIDEATGKAMIPNEFMLQAVSSRRSGGSSDNRRKSESTSKKKKKQKVQE